MNPAIVVIAYSRPQALRRLLRSMAAAVYPQGGVPLVVSIDRSEDGRSTEVAGAAREFPWPHGPKDVIERERRLGLVSHFLECGRLSQRYGGAVLLEDDLVVAPPYYAFARQALQRYGEDERIAAVCLYGLWFNGFTLEPFQAIDDGADVFFLQLPYTQGLAFSAGQWRRFEEWTAARPPAPHPDLHDAFLRFPEDEWFPRLAYHTAATRRFVCFPRASLTTGWGDPGAHFPAETGWLQTPLRLAGTEYRLPDLDEALAVYDPFFELLPDRLRRLAAGLADVEFDLDLNATKERRNLRGGYVLTSRRARRARASFGLRMYPPEANIAYGVPGDDLCLARVEDVYWDAWAAAEARGRLHAYAWAKLRPSRRRSLGFQAARALARLRQYGEKGRKRRA